MTKTITATKSLFVDETTFFDQEKTEEAKKKLKETKKGIQGKEVVPERNIAKKENLAPVCASELLGEKENVTPVTALQLKKIYHKKVNNETLNEMANIINKSIMPMEESHGYGISEHFKEIALGYLGVMSDNQTNTFQEYVNAAKFITFRQAGDNLTRAYAKTFPDRVKRMEAEKVPFNYLATYAQVYSKGKLVTKIQAQVAVPTHILFQDVFYKAVATQAAIMEDTKVSPKVRSDAANSLLTHLRTPEVKKMEIDVGVKESPVISELKETLANISNNQRNAIINGDYDITDVSSAQLIEKEELDD